ncbi:MAG: hypothetical protein KatS3mg061_3225 [Dehalococcoidia bacterium]|nr:MAG: hypothetical protein KatS3mg061_3225 [Dehalococcoidia bacterium]
MYTGSSPRQSHRRLPARRIYTEKARCNRPGEGEVVGFWRASPARRVRRARAASLLATLLVALLLLTGQAERVTGASGRPSPVVAPAQAAPAATDRVLVRFRPNTTPARTLASLGLAPARELPALGVHVLPVDSSRVASIVSQLRASPAVEFAEPDYRLSILDQPSGRALDADDGRELTSGSPLTGTVSPADESDSYFFRATAGQRATLRMSRLSLSLDPYLRLYDPTEQLIASDDDSGGDLNALLWRLTLPLSGRYRVEAASFAQASSGPYEIALTLEEAPTPTTTPTPTPARSPTATPTASPPPSTSPLRPNDPAFQAGQQYGLSRIRAPEGWGYSTGSESIIIAIVDTGVDLSHPDLASKILPGYDFVNADLTPQDDHGHGTHVAGIAAAITNNGLGIAGVSWGARVLPVKVLDARGSGYTSDVAAGIVWAADRGARVINLSLGGPASTTLQEAVNYAVGKGALVVAAAGNSGNSTPNYPGAYPAAISVAATDSTNRRASFSNFGPFVDLAAPGVSIYSTVPTGSCDLCHPSGYRALSGTSMATPMVAGVLAILAGLAPEASPAGLRAAVEQSALDLGPAGRDDEYGFGLVQLDAAIRTLRPDLAPAPTATPSPTPTGSSSTPTATPTAMPTATATPTAPSPTPTAPSVPGAPSFTRLSPSQGVTSQPQELLIEGANFLRTTTASLRHTKSGAVVGLANVRILDPSRLLGTVPAGIASGSYDLLLVNPPAAELVVREAYLARDPLAEDLSVTSDDLWTVPARVLTGALVQLGATVQRRGEAPLTVPLRFLQGETVIGEARVQLEEGRRVGWVGVPWNVDGGPGPRSVTVVVDPEGSLPEASKANNQASRTVHVVAASGDTTPPLATSLRVNVGATQVVTTTVRLELSGQDEPGRQWVALAPDPGTRPGCCGGPLGHPPADGLAAVPFFPLLHPN